MGVSPELRKQVIAQMQGAMALDVAYIGVAGALLSALARMEAAAPEDLAATTALDAAYVSRWCDAAFAFGYVDEVEEGRKVRLTDLGRAFVSEEPGTLMGFAVMSMLSAHMAERSATLMKSGERPGERVLAERESLLRLFGPMLEANFAALFEQHILPGVAAYRAVDEKGGVAVDLGCGNGWYLRRMAARFPRVRGIGLDGFEENIRQAARRAEEEGLGHRLTFMVGDIYKFTVREPVDLIAMNRALHHVWDEKEHVFRTLSEHLKPGGSAVIWEPAWPRARADLRHPARRGLSVQNLAEHVQGNHLLRPDEIEAEMRRAGLEPEVYLFADGNEAVVVGRKKL